MRSEHTFYVPCDRAGAGGHPLRVALDGLQVTHLSASCPVGQAADAAARLGAQWCAHGVLALRKWLRGDGIVTTDYEGDARGGGLAGLLRGAAAAADERRMSRHRSAIAREVPPFRVRAWQRHVERQRPYFEAVVQQVDGVLYLRLPRTGMYQAHDGLVVATKHRGCRWVVDDENLRSSTVPQAIGSRYVKPNHEECRLQCGLLKSGFPKTFKDWSGHARSEAHQSRARIHFRQTVAALNKIPSLVTAPVPKGYDPLRAMSEERQARREAVAGEYYG